MQTDLDVIDTDDFGWNQNEGNASGSNARKDVLNKQAIGRLYILSAIIFSLVLAASVIGLLFPDLIYPTTEIFESFVPNDVVNICIGLPLLLVSMWLTWRHKFVGPLLWVGALIFIAYNYTVYVLALEPSAVYVVIASIVILCAYSIYLLLSSMDRDGVKERLEGNVYERLSAAVPFLFGAAFLFVALSNIVTSATSGNPLSRLELALNSTDSIFCSVWILCSIQLWRGRSIGYVTGLGLLFQASMLFFALVVFLIVQPIVTSAPFMPVDVIVVLIMGLVSLIPFALYARGINRQEDARKERLHLSAPSPE